MVSYFNQNQKFRGAEWRKQNREKRVSKLDWVRVIRVNRIREEQSEQIKIRENIRLNWVISDQTYQVGERGSYQTYQSGRYQEERRGEFVIAEMSGRLTRDEEERRGNFLRRKRERGGVMGIQAIAKREREIGKWPLRGYENCHRGKGWQVAER